jgi:hypothetical protein
VTRWLGQVNSCRRGDGSACAAVERGRRLAVALGGDRTAGRDGAGSDASRRGGRPAAQVGGAVAC